MLYGHSILQVLITLIFFILSDFRPHLIHTDTLLKKNTETVGHLYKLCLPPPPLRKTCTEMMILSRINSYPTGVSRIIYFNFILALLTMFFAAMHSPLLVLWQPLPLPQPSVSQLLSVVTYSCSFWSESSWQHCWLFQETFKHKIDQTNMRQQHLILLLKKRFIYK